MLKIKNITAKNFLSIGNVSQAVSFIDNHLVLVLGENLDQGGNDSRNGVGKSAALNALSYALYGEAIVKIKKDNLINKINTKGMLVTLEFEKDGNTYRIERGRRPGIFKFYANGKVYGSETAEDTTDEAQGDSRVTQEEIEKTIGISHSMFRQIIALNTYNEPFLSLRANEQREIIEQLLGITKLSEKAEVLRENLRITKDDIKEEEFRIKAIEETNRRISQNISSLQIKESAWRKTHENTISELTEELSKLGELDIDVEITNHKHNQLFESTSVQMQHLLKEKANTEREIKMYQKSKDSALKDIDNLCHTDGKQCPTCGSDMHDDKHDSLVEAAKKKLSDSESALETLRASLNAIEQSISAIPELGRAVTVYSSIDHAYDHKSTVDSLANELERELKQQNPFTDQISNLTQTGIQEVSFDRINDLNSLKDHQEFLLKLLTSKDSFIRKKIIDHNLHYLNSRLSNYLEKLGLPHEVKFKSDLEVEISQYGREFDFDNLSRGERTRLVLSLSWAFRDVFESLNSKINLMFIDELIDNGLDTSGVESALSVLKRMVAESNRNVFLISHRDELIGRVTGILKVTKEGGFSTFELTNTGNI